ncbi:gluconokinase [Laspinema sp. D1]|uniref:gluconokinase n=1 Tax=Laspinema palackyanum TaxID=3231601 RepID=UPI00347ABE9A|nr:gluconokinase [Laspinema sp. D2b]
MTIVIIMGVSGSGKTTVGKRLAEALDWQFMDADDLHSPENVEKMSRGIPLDESDRLPWLMTMRQQISAWLQQDKNVVLACSALKQSYREILDCPLEPIKLVYLKGSQAVIEERMRSRSEHFMSPDLLNSQFEALEEPTPEEAIHLDVSLPISEIVERIVSLVQGLA